MDLEEDRANTNNVASLRLQHSKQHWRPDDAEGDRDGGIGGEDPGARGGNSLKRGRDDEQEQQACDSPTR